MTPRIFIVAFCVLLAGCSFEMPVFDSGKLEQHLIVDGYDRVAMSALSAEQLTALSKWFSAHKSGWEQKGFIDPAPVKFVYLSRGGTSVAYFNLSGNILYAASYSRILTSDEQLALETIFGVKKEANQSPQPNPQTGG